MKKNTWIAFFCAAFAFSVSAGEATYSNPVIAGDYPDPSVIRVGKHFWATATTSDWAPLFPLLRSRDLTNWKQVGNVFQRRPDWAVGMFWAPEISEYKGRYYIYYVGRQRNGPLAIAVTTADRPEGPYTDHGPLIGQEDGSIDAFPINDEHGKRYLVWKEDGNSRKRPTPIWAQELSDDGTKLIGEMHELIRNDSVWEGNLVEGPCIIRHGGYFYMFYSGNACCGRACTYGLGVARAKALLGPWEKDPNNPVIQGNDIWKCPGHGTVVADASGRDFLLYHAYSARDLIYVGRQALLDRVDWPSDGWPRLSDRTPSTNFAAPFGIAAHHEEETFSDNFKTSELRPEWQWPQANEPVVKLLGRGKGVMLSPNHEHANDPIGAVLAIKSSSGDYVATTELDAGKLSEGLSAGLSAYGDHANALGLSIKGKTLTLWKRQQNKEETLATAPLEKAQRLSLRMQAHEGHKFSFQYGDGKTWQRIGADVDVEGAYLPPWDRGIRIALTAGGAGEREANFRSLRIEPSRK